jgi:hypothetical protein
LTFWRSRLGSSLTYLSPRRDDHWFSPRRRQRKSRATSRK